MNLRTESVSVRGWRYSPDELFFGKQCQERFVDGWRKKYGSCHRLWLADFVV